MARLIVGRTCLAAWMSAVNVLLEDNEIENCVIDIERPLPLDEGWLERYDPRRVDSNVKRSCKDVANTIFPKKDFETTRNRYDFYARYLSAFERGRRWHRNRSTWGTYFSRMICFGTNRVNRLEQIIHALNSWQGTHRAAFNLHLSAQDIDSLRPLASPCLQYIQFAESPQRALSMTVIVRNHDYFQKGLGNFVGAARLLQFMCDSTGREPGRLTFHSVHAYLNASKTAVRQLLK